MDSFSWLPPSSLLDRATRLVSAVPIRLDQLKKVGGELLLLEPRTRMSLSLMPLVLLGLARHTQHSLWDWLADAGDRHLLPVPLTVVVDTIALLSLSLLSLPSLSLSLLSLEFWIGPRRRFSALTHQPHN